LRKGKNKEKNHLTITSGSVVFGWFWKYVCIWCVGHWISLRHERRRGTTKKEKKLWIVLKSCSLTGSRAWSSCDSSRNASRCVFWRNHSSVSCEERGMASHFAPRHGRFVPQRLFQAAGIQLLRKEQKKKK
jgi:hypothetical protein